MLERNLRLAGLILLVGCSRPPPAAPAQGRPAAVHQGTSPRKEPSTERGEPELCVEHRTGAVFQSGYASWYGARLAGHPTASGERFDPSKLTAAHRTLPLGTWVRVRRTDDGRVVTVRINDRGPVSHRFCIDLSSGAARELHMLRMGVAPVEIRIVPRP